MLAMQWKGRAGRQASGSQWCHIIVVPVGGERQRKWQVWFAADEGQGSWVSGFHGDDFGGGQLDGSKRSCLNGVVTCACSMQDSCDDWSGVHFQSVKTRDTQYLIVRMRSPNTMITLELWDRLWLSRAWAASNKLKNGFRNNIMINHADSLRPSVYLQSELSEECMASASLALIIIRSDQILQACDQLLFKYRY